jgi:adenylate kinase
MGRRLVIVVLGKQGSGKGTQCQILSEHYSIPHVSTGDILRAAVKAESPLGLEVKAIMDRGELVADDLIMGLVADRLAEPDATAGALLDGCTRTRGQAEALEELLGGDGIALALSIDVPTELVTDRLSSRRVCQECGTIYRDSDPAAISGTCEKCGGDVIQRADDQPDAIRQRLAAYERDTAPLLAYYAERGLLETVDGNQDVAAVAGDINKVIESRGLA